MDWRNHSHNCGFLESEGDLVCLVVPQMIYSVALSVVEVLLRAIEATQISRAVKG